MQEKLIELAQKSWPWISTSGVKIIAILIGADIVIKIIRVAIDKSVRKLIRRQPGMSATAERQREDTLIKVFGNTIKIVIWIIAVITALSEAGLDIGPLIATAGVAGIALGFGGQYLIKDIISGFFIILENQYRIGDIIKVAGVAGKVEDINLRLTVLRDADGIVHYVPNGEIKTASNMTKQFSRINIKIGVSYDADLDKVKAVINQVGQDLAEDFEWKDKIKKAPEFVRVDEFADSSVTLKIGGETVASDQWDVAGELRLRLKKAFDKEGIEIPFPQRVIHQAK